MKQKTVTVARPRDDGLGWAVDLYKSNGTWIFTWMGDSNLTKEDAQAYVARVRSGGAIDHPTQARQTGNEKTVPY